VPVTDWKGRFLLGPRFAFPEKSGVPKVGLLPLKVDSRFLGNDN